MALKTEVVLLLYVMMHLVCVNCISGISNYQDQVNTISEDDRRAAATNKIKSEPDLHISSSESKHNYYLPPAYDSGGYDHGVQYHPQYLPPPVYYSPGLHGYHDHGYDEHKHQEVHHGSGGHKGGGILSTLALKGILIPLAGIALLGAAAALTTNPVLLQLGVVNGRRRKRSLMVYPANPKLKPYRENSN